MRKWSAIFALSAIAFGQMACEKEADIKLPPYQPKIVINSIFNPDSTWEVQIDRSRGVLEEGTDFSIDDALVEIYKGESRIATLNHTRRDGRSFYKSVGEMPESTVEYTLRVSKEGLPTIVAKSKIPEKPALAEDLALSDVEINGNRFSANIELDLAEATTNNKFFHLVLYRAKLRAYGNGYTVEGYEAQPFSIHNIGSGTSENGQGVIFSDENLKGGSTIELSISAPYDAAKLVDDHFLVELRAVNKDYYRYHETVNEQFFGPTNNLVEIYSNVEGGLGIFAGYNATSRKVHF